MCRTIAQTSKNSKLKISKLSNQISFNPEINVDRRQGTSPTTKMAVPYAYVLLTIFLWRVQGQQLPNLGLQKKKKLMTRSHSSEVSDKFCELSEDIRAIIKKSNQAKAINFIHSTAKQVEQLESTHYRKMTDTTTNVINSAKFWVKQQL